MAAKCSAPPPDDLAELVRRIVGAGVAVTALPVTDLFTLGCDRTRSVRRCSVEVSLLVERGVNRSISNNNVLNPFAPPGDYLLATKT